MSAVMEGKPERILVSEMEQRYGLERCEKVARATGHRWVQGFGLCTQDELDGATQLMAHRQRMKAAR